MVGALFAMVVTCGGQSQPVFATASQDGLLVRVQTFSYVGGRVEAMRSAEPKGIDGSIQDLLTSPRSKRLLLSFQKGSSNEVVAQAHVLTFEGLVLEQTVRLSRPAGWLRWIDDEAFEHYLFTDDAYHRKGQLSLHKAPGWSSRKQGLARVPLTINAPEQEVVRIVQNLEKRGIQTPSFHTLERRYNKNNIRFLNSYCALKSDGSVVVIAGHMRPRDVDPNGRASIILIKADSQRVIATPEQYRSIRFLKLWQDLVVLGTVDKAGKDIIVFLRQKDLTPIYQVPGTWFSAAGMIPTALQQR